MPIKEKVSPSPPAVERLGLHLPSDLSEQVRVEAARARESISSVVTRRLRESYAKSSKRESANAL